MRIWNRFIDWIGKDSVYNGKDSLSGKDYNETQSHYKYIIVGGGTGGCITAYTLAKEMEQHHIAGRVLLIDGGKPYVHADGPHPKMWEWFENWSKYSLIHDTFGIGYIPAHASSHIGIGGCGAHDTRITFYPTCEQRQRISDKMKWSFDQFNEYLQLALNMMPLNSAGAGERFYDAVLKTLDTNGILNRVQGDEFKGHIIPNSAAYVSIAMWSDETRWTSAYLLEKSVRPQNLDIRTDFFIDKVTFDSNNRACSVVSEEGQTISLDTTITNDSEIIIAAGSLGTPAILQRSGIGPKSTLEKLGIPIVVANDEVGHGVDHTEIPVTYEWLPQWNEPDGTLPRGGPMAWPIVMFIDDGIMAHFGISPPPYGGNYVTGTPNCMRPDHSAGFRATIQSTDPKVPICVHHDELREDLSILKRGVYKMIDVFNVLQKHDVVGKRLTPSETEDIDQYILNNVGTAYHWMSTCKAGIDPATTIADEHFRVRGVQGLRVGSGAALPELTEANPHLTISAFSIALAHSVIESSVKIPPFPQIQCELMINRQGDNPVVEEVAKSYRKWKKD